MALPQIFQAAADQQLKRACLNGGLRNERATDALAISIEPLRVGLAQNHAYRWQDRDVQNSAELLRKFHALFEHQRDATIA